MSSCAGVAPLRSSWARISSGRNGRMRMAGETFGLAGLIAAVRHIHPALANGKALPRVRKKGSLSKQLKERSRRFAAICLVFVASGIGLGVKSASAQDTAQGKVLRVAVKPIQPFVLKQGT